MTHLWVRAESRENEDRVGLTPEGAKALIASGMRLTVERSQTRVIPITQYEEAGCRIEPEHSWPSAPKDAIIFGLKELPDDGSPLTHRHIMFGHAFKGQYSGRRLLERFKAGGGTLFDLEYLVNEAGQRVAAFGYWAGYAGAAVSLMAWAAQQQGQICPPVAAYANKDALLADLRRRASNDTALHPTAIVIGALGRVGTGAADLCTALDVKTTLWDITETRGGGPFPEILAHSIFLNCIFARPGTPVFVPSPALTQDRELCVIGDVACDPDSDYNPVPLYQEATTWAKPVTRVATTPVLDIMAIDNLPSLLPLESSLDFAQQLLPSLQCLDSPAPTVWSRAKDRFRQHMGGI